jgi:hypothetical protein
MEGAMSTTVTVLAYASALVAALGGVLAFRRRRARLVFEAEYAHLVAETALDFAALRGPGRDPGDAVLGDPLHTGPLPRRLTDAEVEYYTSSWEHVRGEFAEAPAVALDLAEHLTSKLLLTRGLTAAGAWQPVALPATWQFPTARGYRRAQLISARAQGAGPLDPTPSNSELETALELYQAFFREIMLLPAARDSEI